MLIESVIDPPQQKLSPYIFKETAQGYKLLPDVRQTILLPIAELHKQQKVWAVYIVGGIASYNYTTNSDIDVTITVNELSSAKSIIKEYSGKKYIGPHILNYFVRTGWKLHMYDSIYDVINNEWLKGPSNVNIDITDYLDAFESVAANIDASRLELLSDLAEYYYLQSFTSDDTNILKSRIKNKLIEIDADIVDLSSKYHYLINARRDAVESPEKLNQYITTNAAPENVVYLLLRKYCYIDLLSTIDALQRKNGSVNDIAAASKSFNSCRSDTI